MIDRELVTRKIVLISKDVEELRKLSTEGLEKYLADPIKEVIAERLLERTITRLIDINYHLITESGRPPPKDYHESFIELGAMGILDRAFAARIAMSAGLRNRIVHEYDDIDPRKVFDAITAALADLPVYLDAVLKYPS